MPTSWLLQWDTRSQSRPRLFGVETGTLPTVQWFRDSTGAFVVLDGHLVEQPGTSKSTRSDAERLVAVAQERGDAALEALRGAFLVVFWDDNQRKLSVVRDISGQQTAYFSWRNDTLLISPCLETLLATPSVGHELNRPLIAEMLQLRFHDQQIKETHYAEIRRLPPGHRLTLHRRRFAMSRYWKPEDIEGCGRSVDLEGSLETAIARCASICHGLELVDSVSSLALATAVRGRDPQRELPALIPNLSGPGGERPTALARELGLRAVPVFCALGTTVQPISTFPANPGQLLRTGLFETAEAARVDLLLLADDPGTAPRPTSWAQIFSREHEKSAATLDSWHLPIRYRSFFRPQDEGLQKMLRHRRRYTRPLKGSAAESMVRSGAALQPHPISLLEREHNAGVARQHGVFPIYPMCDRDLVEARLAADSKDLSTMLARRLRTRFPELTLPAHRPSTNIQSVRRHLLGLRNELGGFPRLASLGMAPNRSLVSFSDGFFAGRHPFGLPVWLALSLETWLSKASHHRSWEFLVASPPPKGAGDTTTLPLRPAVLAG